MFTNMVSHISTCISMVNLSNCSVSFTMSEQTYEWANPTHILCITNINNNSVLNSNSILQSLHTSSLKSQLMLL